MLFVLLLSLELADKVTMKRDLEIAREIQTWLVPSQPPEVPGANIAFATRPQNSVAGDYYDAFYPNPEERERLMVVIADVAGKSVPAALLMATLQASLRTIAGENAPLADLVARLNRYACAHSLNGLRFTTAVLSDYNPPSPKLTYVNAGHNAPILRRANGTLETLEVGGLPLGIRSDVKYETASLALRPGDALIFFTDGVVEAFNESGEEFGNERWLSAIRNLPDWDAQQTLQYLMKRVDEFAGATRQSDDITCLVFRIRYQALLVGGCVRDLLLGRAPADYDVPTDATPERVMALFPESIAVGAQFGVILIPRDGLKVEVATFRSDVGYSDGRHPDSVVYSKTPQEDVQRRDFSINGLLMRHDSGEVLDYVGGQADLKAKVIRAIGEPGRRFTEDKLRKITRKETCGFTRA